MSKQKEDKKKLLITDLGRKFSDTTILLHEHIATKAGLSGADHKYLGLIMQHGVMTAGQIANITGLTTGAVTGLIDRLEKKKLVKREYDKSDRRKVVIVPNQENAMKLLGPIFGELQTQMEKAMAQYTDKETDVIEHYLRTTIDVMTEFIFKLKADKRSTNR